MLKVTQETLKNQILRDSLRRIYGCTKFGPRRARQIGQDMKKINVELAATDERFDEIIQAHAVKDENGHVKPLEGGQKGSFRIAPEHEEEFEKRCDAIMNTEVELPIDGFTMEDLEIVDGLSPAHLTSLESFIH